LPPTFVSVGSAETPRDDILGFVERLRAAKVDVTLHVAQDMPHNATLFEAYHPSAKAAFAAVVQVLRDWGASPHPDHPLPAGDVDHPSGGAD
jgi:acetyl esterase/lipase